jgi:hypothetical protein
MTDRSKELYDEFQSDAGQVIRHLLVSGDNWDLDELREISAFTNEPEPALSDEKLAHIAELTASTVSLAYSDGSMGYTANARESLTEIALRLSLCPLHLIDYAICFDDEDDECAQIRTIHPSHDT